MPTAVASAIKPTFCTIDGLRIRFAETERRDEHALLLSPWPASLFAYDQMWERLGDHAHLVAVDLPGFGHSEGRPSLLSPRAMAKFVIGALWDWAVPPSNHRYLDRLLPNSKLDLVDAAHFPWEDVPDVYADLIIDWWCGGYGRTES